MPKFLSFFSSHQPHFPAEIPHIWATISPNPPFALYRHEQTFVIGPEHCAENGVLSPSGLASLFQKAAWDSAAELGASTPRLQQDGLTWVLYRLQVEADSWPVAGTTVAVHTWPSGKERMMILRDYRLVAGDRELIRARSSWLIFDLKKRRLAPAPPYVESALLSLKTPPGFVPAFTAPEPAESFEGANMFPKAEDEDMNGHISHVKLMAWLFSGLASPAASLASFDITFKKEALKDDGLKIEFAAQPDGTHHRISRLSNTELLVSGFSLWR